MGWIVALIGLVCLAASMFILIRFLDQRRKNHRLFAVLEDSRKINLILICRIAFEDWKNMDTQRGLGAIGDYDDRHLDKIYGLICDEVLPLYFGLGFEDRLEGRRYLSSFDDEEKRNIRKSISPYDILFIPMCAYCQEAYDIGFTEAAEVAADNPTIH